VPISDELVRMLLELKMAAPDKDGPVFASLTGSRLGHRNVERRGFDAAAQDAGIEGVTQHDLRHAYGSRLASRVSAPGRSRTRWDTSPRGRPRFTSRASTATRPTRRVRAAMSG
jgi:integrase